MRRFSFLLSAALILCLIGGATPTTTFGQSGRVHRQETGDSSPTPRRSGSVVIPSGTILRLSLQTPINTKMNEVNDPVSATLEDSFFLNGTLLFGKGTEFRGYVAQISPAKVGQRQATLQIQFNEIITDTGTQPIASMVIAVDDYVNESRRKADEDGEINGGRSGRRTVDNTLRGGGIGWLGASTVLLAGGGGAAAAATLGGGALAGVLLTKGNDLRLQPGSTLKIQFTEDAPINF
ncbi:MAG: hypothetical protein HY774_23985 [Acidobacteria bacterium]|nr:hypothetical protein [Acidobacteriota bacterium]